MAYTKEELQQFFVTTYRLIDDLLKRTKKGHALLAKIIERPTASTIGNFKYWQAVVDCLSNKDAEARAMAFLAAKATLLLIDQNRRDPLAHASITMESSEIYFGKSIKISTISEQWDIIHSLLITAPQITHLRIARIFVILFHPPDDFHKSPFERWIKFFQILGSLTNLKVLDFSKNLLPDFLYAICLPPFLSALEKLICLTKLNLSECLHSPNFEVWEKTLPVLQKLPLLEELDISNSFLYSALSDRLKFNMLCTTLKNMSNLRILNFSYNNLGRREQGIGHLKELPEKRQEWLLLCELISSLQQLNILVLAFDHYEIYLNEWEWEQLYTAITTHQFLAIEGLPINTPEKLKKLIEEHRQLQEILTDAKNLSVNPNNINLIHKVLQALQIINSKLNSTSVPIEVRLRLQNQKDELLWSLTRAQLTQTKSNNSTQASASNTDSILKPEHWLEISTANPGFLEARIELFLLLYRQQRGNHQKRLQAFLYALPILLDDKGKLLFLETWQAVFDRMLLEAIDIPLGIQQELSDETRLACLQYLVLKDFWLFNPEQRIVLLAPLLTLSSSTNIITSTSSSFWNNNSSAFYRHLGAFSLQKLSQNDTQIKINGLWDQLILHLNNQPIDENHRACITAITKYQQHIHQQQIEKNQSPLQAFINALRDLSPSASDSNSMNDQLLLKATHLNDQLTIPLLTDTRIALIQYLLILCLAQEKHIEDKPIIIKNLETDIILLSKSSLSNEHKIESKVADMSTSTTATITAVEEKRPLLLTDFENTTVQALLIIYLDKFDRKLKDETVSEDIKFLISHLECLTKMQLSDLPSKVFKA